jgi:hypothetical protein
MCCVSAWHNLWHPKIRPERIDAGGVAIEEFQRDLWLFAATKVRGSDRMWGGIGWNRRNLVALLVVARPIEGEDLPESYWQSIKRGDNDVFRSHLRTKQAATLRFEEKVFARAIKYWCSIPLWLAWSVVSAYPVFVVARRLLVRRLRRRRGQCLACGYNLAGNVSGVCSECGTRVPGRTGHETQ